MSIAVVSMILFGNSIAMKIVWNIAVVLKFPTSFEYDIAMKIVRNIAVILRFRKACKLEVVFMCKIA